MFYKFADDISLKEMTTVVDQHNEKLGERIILRMDRGDHVIFKYAYMDSKLFPTFDKEWSEKVSFRSVIHHIMKVNSWAYPLVLSVWAPVIALSLAVLFDVSRNSLLGINPAIWYVAAVAAMSVALFMSTFLNLKNSRHRAYRNNAILREARGIIFDKVSGKVISRSFTKFFNLGENQENAPSNIDWTAPHDILQKLDGSMVRPFRMGYNLRWATKSGVSEFSPIIANFVDRNPSYKKFVVEMISDNKTPLFEWCSPKNQIVIKYPEDKLVLIAVRDNKTGAMENHASLKNLGFLYNIDVVDGIDGDGDWNALVEKTRALKNDEGVIVAFHNGMRLKIKADEYRSIHRVKSDFNSEKHVWNLYFDEAMDDAKAALDGEDKLKIELYEEAMNKSIADLVNTIKDYVAEWKVGTPAGTPKDFFQAIDKDSTVNSQLKSQYMTAFKGGDVRRELCKMFKFHGGSNIRIASVKPLLGDVSWDGIMFTSDED